MTNINRVTALLAAILVLYIASGIIIILYQALFQQPLSARFAYSLLLALAALKGTLILLRRQHSVPPNY